MAAAASLPAAAAIISVAAQLAAAMRAGQTAPATAGGVNAQQLINEINRRTQMFGTSPIMGG